MILSSFGKNWNHSFSKKRGKNRPTLVQTIHLLTSPLFSYLSTCIEDLLLVEWVTKVKPDINSVEVHPQLSSNGHPVDGAASLWPGWCTREWVEENKILYQTTDVRWQSESSSCWAMQAERTKEIGWKNQRNWTNQPKKLNLHGAALKWFKLKHTSVIKQLELKIWGLKSKRINRTWVCTGTNGACWKWQTFLEAGKAQASRPGLRRMKETRQILFDGPSSCRQLSSDTKGSSFQVRKRSNLNCLHRPFHMDTDFDRKEEKLMSDCVKEESKFWGLQIVHSGGTCNGWQEAAF